MKKICVKGLELTVFKSRAGYYVGTEDLDPEIEDIVPNCRITDYTESEQESITKLIDGDFERQGYSECLFCNQIGMCILD